MWAKSGHGALRKRAEDADIASLISYFLIPEGIGTSASQSFYLLAVFRWRCGGSGGKPDAAFQNQPQSGLVIIPLSVALLVLAAPDRAQPGRFLMADVLLVIFELCRSLPRSPICFPAS
jgi:hypothetical protein